MKLLQRAALAVCLAGIALAQSAPKSAAELIQQVLSGLEAKDQGALAA